MARLSCACTSRRRMRRRNNPASHRQPAPSWRRFFICVHIHLGIAKRSIASFSLPKRQASECRHDHAFSLASVSENDATSCKKTRTKKTSRAPLRSASSVKGRSAPCPRLRLRAAPRPRCSLRSPSLTAPHCAASGRHRPRWHIAAATGRDTTRAQSPSHQRRKVWRMKR